MNASSLAGVYAAAVTPILDDGSPDLEGLITLLDFLAGRGCHGALLFGTTGEGPSFSLAERIPVMQAALGIRQQHPGFKLFAGTGTPSLGETIEITRAAFTLGYDAAVILPPYYFRKVQDDGLFTWFEQIIQRAVPSDGAIIGYHIPPVTGVSLSCELLARLIDSFPNQFAGVKDSSASADHARRLGQFFGKDLAVFNGTDRFFTLALQSQASGCITALANLRSPDLRLVWEAHQRGGIDTQAQSRLSTARDVLENFPPVPPLVKGLLHHQYQLPLWSVRPPLLPASSNVIRHALAELEYLKT